MQLLFHVISSSVWFSLVVSVSDIKYLNRWSVQIDGGKEEAERLAKKHGFVNEGKASLMHVHVPALLYLRLEENKLVSPFLAVKGLTTSQITINVLLGWIFPFVGP